MVCLVCGFPSLAPDAWSVLVGMTQRFRNALGSLRSAWFGNDVYFLGSEMFTSWNEPYTA